MLPTIGKYILTYSLATTTLLFRELGHSKLWRAPQAQANPLFLPNSLAFESEHDYFWL